MNLPDLEYDWTRIYGNVLEEIPKDAPEPLGKSVTTSTFLDANLLHDLITGRSVTAVLHFFNLTPGDWYSKRQATVECNLWIRVCCCQDCYCANCRHQTNSQVLRSSYQVQGLHVW